MSPGAGLDALFVRVNRRPIYIPRPAPSEQLGLLYVATAAEKAGFRVQVLDAPTTSVRSILDRLRVSGSRLVGFYVDHENVHATLSVGEMIKREYPETKLVAGGPQAREWDARIVQGGFDAAVRCEGEQVIADLVNWSQGARHSLFGVSGVTWAKDGKVVRNADAPPIDLDAIPQPNRLLNPDRRYPDGAESIVTGRGCPFRCAFCYEGRAEAKYRARALPNVLEELEYLVTERAARYVSILDDVFTLSAKRVTAFADGVNEIRRRTGADFVWFCEARADVIAKRPDMVHACVEAGLVRMQIGMETGSQSVLDAYNKALEVDETVRAIEICRDADVLSIIGNFIVGGAHETAETAEQTRRFAESLIDLAPGRVDVTTTLFTPYPGTPMYEHPERFGLQILDKDCVTGPGDNYPFVRTEALSRWDIVEHRQRLIQTVEQAMLRNAVNIPAALADRHFRAYTYYGLRTSWFDHFCRNFSSYNYYGMPASDVDVIRMRDVEERDLLEFKPLRTVMLGSTLDQKFVVDTGYERIQLGPVPGALYELCAGKLKLREIVGILHDRGILEAPEQALGLLRTLDEKRLLVFTRI
jgi:anaerobic magnesium-protoporphyrin IX monomethyl ester cyclase